jgi:lipid-binding SYLF domain-containing protein
MTYNDDLTWEDLSKIAGQQASDLISVLLSAMNNYNEWQSFRAGRTNATIATALGKTETQIAEIDACFVAFIELYNTANNSPPYQSDRFYSMRKFS